MYAANYETPRVIPSTAGTPSYTSLGVIEEMLDGPAQLDWVRTSIYLLGPELTRRLSSVCTTAVSRG